MPTPSNSRPTRAAIYVRCSTGHQDTGMQVDDCRAGCGDRETRRRLVAHVRRTRSEWHDADVPGRGDLAYPRPVLEFLDRA